MSSDSREADGGESGGTDGPVSRRRFVRVAGATGAAGLVAGCSTQDPGNGNGNGNGTDGGGVTTGEGGGGEGGSVQIATSDVQGHKEGFRQALHEGGLSDDVDVTFLSTSALSGDTQSQYRQWLQAGRGEPDILRMDNGWTIPFIQRGQIVNLNEELPTETVQSINENYFSASITAASDQDGNLYGVPYQIGLPTVQYRKDLVEEAGFNPSEENWATEPMSWEEFSQVISQTHEQASDLDYGYVWQGSNYVGLSCCTFNELMSSWGGAYFGGLDTLFGPVGDRPVTVDEEPVVNALRMARTFINGQEDEFALSGYQSISPTNVLQWTEGPTQTQFVDGNAVALRYWPSSLPPAHEAFGDDLGAMPIPYGVPPSESQYEGLGGTCSALGGWNMTLNPNSPNKDAALQVLQAMTSDSFRQFQLTELDLLPPDAGILGGGQIGDVDIWGEYADTLNVAGENAVPRPVTRVWPDESPAIAERVNGVLAGQQAPDEGMSQLKNTLQDIESSV